MLASQFEAEELADFLHPGEHDSTPPDNPILKLSLLNFISFLGSSQHTYEAARQNLQLCFPEIELLVELEQSPMEHVKRIPVTDGNR